MHRDRHLEIRSVATTAELVAAGADRWHGDRRVRRGAWLRLAPSVYLTRPGPPTDVELARAAAAHAGPRAVLTGALVCRSLGLPYAPADGAAAVLVPAGARVRSTPWLAVHETTRPPGTWSWHDARCAEPARAVADACRRLVDQRSVRALLLGAVQRGVCGTAALRHEVDAGPQRASGLLRRAVDDAEQGAWSAPEAEAADLVGAAVRAGQLPRAVLNPQLVIGGRALGRPDGWLLGTSVGWQVDSREHHLDPEAYDRTLAVHDAYAAHGLTLLHVTPRRLRTHGPAWVQALVDAVRARPQAPPAALVVRPAGRPVDGRRRADLRPPRR